MAGRARTLQERLAAPGVEDGPTVEDPEEWIDRWREQVAEGEEAAFRRRLERAGLSLAECRDRIRHEGWPRSEPLPEWVDRTEELLGSLADVDRSAVDPPFEEDRPFDEVLWAIVEAVDGRLDGPTSLPSTALDDLRAWLYDRLHRLLVHSLFVEFKTYVAGRDRELVFGDPDPRGTPREHYRAFLRRVFEGGFEDFLVEYAFLARLLDDVAEQWVGVVEEFGRRLRADRAALADRFSAGALGPVVGIDPRGDPHRGGRVVFRVTFRDGTRVAYKPRDVGPESAFSSLLSWAGDRGLPDTRIPTVLERNGYGWVEWVDPADCRTEGEVRGYYRRAGMLVCLAYALGFTDGHLENVVAAGETPVVVDLETLAQPDLDARKVPRDDPVRSILRGSVLRTGFVPVHRPGTATDGASGFGSAGATTDGVEVPVFTDVNTDVMEMDYRERDSLTGENLPRVDGEPVGPGGYVEELVCGFRDTYDTLLEHRDALLADDGPLDDLSGASARLVYRASGTYGSVLASLTTPEYLRSGLAFGCKVETLARPFVTGRADGDLWPVYEAERSALSRLDVPRFTVGLDDGELRWDGRSIGGIVETPPAETVRDRIRELDPDDREEQLDYLRLGYAGDADTGDARVGSIRTTHEWAVGGADTVTGPPAPRDTEADLTALCRRRAVTVAERIRESADASGGDPTWYLREPTPSDGVYPHPVDDDVYHGRLGIALFFAALSAADAGADYGEFAAAVAAPVYREAVGDDPFAGHSIGGCEGVGSVVYGLTKLGTLLDADRYLDAAGRVAATVTPARVRASDGHDVFGGSAGAVLGLLAHWRATGDRGSLNAAVRSGEGVLDGAVDDGGPVWPDPRHGRWLTGFAHGSAGIAYALARLADASGEARFRETALAAVGREDEAYDPVAGNWRDRRPGGDEFFDGWCTGATGIGLARLGTTAHLPDPAVHSGVDRALQGADRTTLPPEDHLCCGTFGRVAFLREAGRVLDDPDAASAARRMTAASLDRAGDRGFPVRWGTEYWDDPTLFGGQAGAGYELLRFVDPSLPCVLLWE